MIFFTSDLHFGHDKEFIWKARGFNSLQEMEAAIVDRWNKTVSEEDAVYILGDVVMGSDHVNGLNLLHSLNGLKVIIPGNHDTDKKIMEYGCVPHTTCVGPRLIKLKCMHELKTYVQQFYLSHYPTYTANFDSSDIYKTVINLHGHTHSKEKFFMDNPFMYNVGMDSHNCTPVSIDEVMHDITDKLTQHQTK